MTRDMDNLMDHPLPPILINLTQKLGSNISQMLNIDTSSEDEDLITNTPRLRDEICKLDRDIDLSPVLIDITDNTRKTRR
jgi:hypothetical protein